MMESVPQFIDVEDKIAGPFTGKQLLWLFGFATTGLILWQFLEFIAFVIVIVPVIMIFGVFMFYRPGGQSLITLVIAAILFVFRPKIYVWERTYHKSTEVVKKKEDQVQIKTKQMTPEELQEITQMLNTRGGYRER